MAKGYVELDDLHTLIEDKVTDRKVANKLLTMVNENLEFKNSDSVYYSPLFARSVRSSLCSRQCVNSQALTRMGTASSQSPFSVRF